MYFFVFIFIYIYIYMWIQYSIYKICILYGHKHMIFYVYMYSIDPCDFIYIHTHLCMYIYIYMKIKWKPMEMKVLVAQSCLSLQPHGLQPTRLLFPWDCPSKNVGVGCHFLLQVMLPTQGFEPGSLALQADSLPSEPPGRHVNPQPLPLKLLGMKHEVVPQTSCFRHLKSYYVRDKSICLFPEGKQLEI